MPEDDSEPQAGNGEAAFPESAFPEASLPLQQLTMGEEKSAGSIQARMLPAQPDEPTPVDQLFLDLGEASRETEQWEIDLFDIEHII